ncbi:UNVERIFIED_CONTAM: hypothetical protein K2H54_020341 [Gekko kuhli]
MLLAPRKLALQGEGFILRGVFFQYEGSVPTEERAATVLILPCVKIGHGGSLKRGNMRTQACRRYIGRGTLISLQREKEKILCLLGKHTRLRFRMSFGLEC